MKNRTKRKMWVERRNGNNEENAGSFGSREEGVRCGKKCLDIEKWVKVWQGFHAGTFHSHHLLHRQLNTSTQLFVPQVMRRPSLAPSSPKVFA